jgi:hypothetical protein
VAGGQHAGPLSDKFLDGSVVFPNSLCDAAGRVLAGAGMGRCGDGDAETFMGCHGDVCMHAVLVFGAFINKVNARERRRPVRQNSSTTSAGYRLRSSPLASTATHPASPSYIHRVAVERDKNKDNIHHACCQT